MFGFFLCSYFFPLLIFGGSEITEFGIIVRGFVLSQAYEGRKLKVCLQTFPSSLHVWKSHVSFFFCAAAEQLFFNFDSYVLSSHYLPNASASCVFFFCRTPEFWSPGRKVLMDIESSAVRTGHWPTGAGVRVLRYLLLILFYPVSLICLPVTSFGTWFAGANNNF